MKTNDTIKVHLYDLHNKEIQTRNYGKVFRVMPCYWVWWFVFIFLLNCN